MAHKGRGLTALVEDSSSSSVPEPKLSGSQLPVSPVPGTLGAVRMRARAHVILQTSLILKF